MVRLIKNLYQIVNSVTEAKRKEEKRSQEKIFSLAEASSCIVRAVSLVLIF